ILAVLCVAFSYRTHPVLRGAVAARRRLATAKKAYRRAQRTYAATTKRLNRMTEGLQEQRRSFEQSRNAASEELQRATTAINATIQRRLVDEAREIAAIDQNAAAERSARLKQVREQHVYLELSKLRVASAPLRGIGSQLCDRLARGGIRTAADFIGYSVT